MTIDEILSEVTILKDCSIPTLPLIILMAVAVILMIMMAIAEGWIFLSVLENGRRHIGLKIATFVAAAGTLLSAVFCIVQLCTLRCFKDDYIINYRIAVNDVKIEQLMEYFDISELLQVDDSTVCHITPKAEYYNEVLVLRDNRKGD